MDEENLVINREELNDVLQEIEDLIAECDEALEE